MTNIMLFYQYFNTCFSNHLVLRKPKSDIKSNKLDLKTSYCSRHPGHFLTTHNDFLMVFGSAVKDCQMNFSIVLS